MDHDVLDLQHTLYTSKNHLRRALHQARFNWITQRIAEGPTGENAIEIGPGSGIYLPYLLDRFDKVTAADIEDRFLVAASELARSNPRLSVRRADLLRLETMPDCKFDLILCTEVIEHLPPGTTAAALKTLREMLRPGGRLIITTPQKWSSLEVTARLALNPFTISLARLFYKEPVNPLGHTNLMTAGFLEQSLRDAGLAISQQELLGLYLPILAEFADKPAFALAEWLERRIRNTPLRWLLWTQCYVASVR